MQDVLNLQDTEKGFAGYSDNELRKSMMLFRVIANPQLAKFGPKLAGFSLRLGLPVRPLIKDSLFGQFCGGETLDECLPKISRLGENGVATILDFATEAVADEAGFDRVCAQVKDTIALAAGNQYVPFAVFKPSGVGDSRLLTKVASGTSLTPEEEAAYQRFETRCFEICKLGYDSGVRVLIDAEESWFQDTVDQVVTALMARFNQDRFCVYNTVQLYRSDRLQFIKDCHQAAQAAGYRLGFKLVRGAYLEKEATYAEENSTENPLHQSKQATDHSFDEAARYCLENSADIAICAGTHNEVSIQKICSLMTAHGLAPADDRVYFAQLYGMSDNLSFNLAAAGFLACKYLPFGKLEELLPYLARRAQENSSLQGQTGRELTLIRSELKRRSSN